MSTPARGAVRAASEGIIGRRRELEALRAWLGGALGGGGGSCCAVRLRCRPGRRPIATSTWPRAVIYPDSVDAITGE